MNTLEVSTSHIELTEPTRLIDRGDIEDVTIRGGQNIQIEYTYLALENHTEPRQRHFELADGTTLDARGIMLGENTLKIISDVR